VPRERAPTLNTPSPADDILTKPYAERQRIVVMDDDAVLAERDAQAAAEKTGKGIDWPQVGKAAARIAVGSVGVVAVEVLTAAAKAREDGLRVLSVSRAEAGEFTLPPGHPRDRVIYIGHPAIPATYYPAAGFHRLAFEHKFAEAIALLMSLGATHLEVEHVCGWSDDFAADLAVPLPAGAGLEVGGRVGRQQSSGSSALFRATLTGSSEPKIPADLVWYPHEPTWQQVAEGRTRYGLREFQLAVRYHDDYGIDAGFKLAAQKVGLELGGKFQEHESTTWRINGTFEA
jgi:hypothetical protein